MIATGGIVRLPQLARERQLEELLERCEWGSSARRLMEEELRELRQWHALDPPAEVVDLDLSGGR